MDGRTEDGTDVDRRGGFGRTWADWTENGRTRRTWTDERDKDGQDKDLTDGQRSRWELTPPMLTMFVKLILDSALSPPGLAFFFYKFNLITKPTVKDFTFM